MKLFLLTSTLVLAAPIAPVTDTVINRVAFGAGAATVAAGAFASGFLLASAAKSLPDNNTAGQLSRSTPVPVTSSTPFSSSGAGSNFNSSFI